MQEITVPILKEALLYDKQANQRVLCNLCPHRCVIDEGKRGICQVRENRDGSLYTLVFGRPFIQNIDAIEKKPLFHFHPGSKTYSIATKGCNFHCQYCINWEISQTAGEALGQYASMTFPEQIITNAQRAGCQSIAYTYVEPTIFFEYIQEIGLLAKRAGLFNIFKTNGFMTAEMLELCQPYLDAANVDLKTFRDHTYRQFGGRLQPVLDSLRRMRRLGIWLEVTTVIIPGLNDDIAEIQAIASFIVKELGADTPWHITRFFPAYKMEKTPPTPVSTLYQAREIGLAEGLRYVYFGNFLENGKQDTVCRACGQILIRRRGFQLLEINIRNHACPNCGMLIPGLGFNEPTEVAV